jgi:DNA-binding NarL/FixJ family response regulator
MKLGKSNRQIAEELRISLGTAKNHVGHIIAKLGVSDRTQAVVRGLELGILGLSAEGG